MNDETLKRLDDLGEAEAISTFLRCCGARGWAREMTSNRPFRGIQELVAVAEKVFAGMRREDWLEAFAHHPKIGDLESLAARFPGNREWSAGEQAGVRRAREETLEALAAGNRAYEEKFGYIFIVCAAGKSAKEILALLTDRLQNSPDEELEIAAREQIRITLSRLEKTDLI